MKKNQTMTDEQLARELQNGKRGGGRGKLLTVIGCAATAIGIFTSVTALTVIGIVVALLGQGVLNKHRKAAGKAVFESLVPEIMNANFEDVQPIGKQQYMELSKDIFVFSYLCGGINFTDIANLAKENIQNGRLHYIRQKTKKLIKIGIPQEAMQIIEKYSKESKGYLFPILDSKIHKTALQKQNRIHKILGKVNKNLKLLAADLGAVSYTHLTLPTNSRV